MRPNGNINTKWAKVLYLFGKKYFLYRSQVFLLISFLGTFFKLLELSRFITLLYRSSRPEVFCKKCVLENSAKFTELHLCQSLFFNKVAGLRPAALLKKRLWDRCFPVNFVKFLRTPFYIEHLWWLLLTVWGTLMLKYILILF